MSAGIAVKIRRAISGIGVIATIVMSTAGPAGAAGFYHEHHRHKNGNSGFIHLRTDFEYMGTVTWNADPIDYTKAYGDSIYVSDRRSDGYAIMGQAKLASTGEIIARASTAGKTAPVTVRSTKNIPEGTKIYFRACLEKPKGSFPYCSGWYSGWA
jgi:hypothetical protein